MCVVWIISFRFRFFFLIIMNTDYKFRISSTQISIESKMKSFVNALFLAVLVFGGHVTLSWGEPST